MWFSSGTERKAAPSAEAEVLSIQSVALKMLSVAQSSHRAACSQTTAPSSHPPLDLDASTYRQSAQASTVRHSGHSVMVSLIAGATELSACVYPQCWCLPQLCRNTAIQSVLPLLYTFWEKHSLYLLLVGILKYRPNTAHMVVLTWSLWHRSRICRIQLCFLEQKDIPGAGSSKKSPSK